MLTRRAHSNGSIPRALPRAAMASRSWRPTIARTGPTRTPPSSSSSTGSAPTTTTSRPPRTGHSSTAAANEPSSHPTTPDIPATPTHHPPRRKRQQSAAFDSGHALPLAPRLDDEVVGWIAAEGGEHDLGDVDAEEMEGLRRLLALLLTLLPDEPVEGLLVGDLVGPAGELGVPARHLGIHSGAVERQPWIAQEIPRLARLGHHAEPELTVAERRFLSADPG